MLGFQPTRAEFPGLCRQANTVPVYASLLSDQLTPVSAFERIAAGAGHAFLLESVVGGEKIARYSFLGADPLVLVEAKDRRTTVSGPTGRQAYDDADPL
ncbi:MAG: anthranilate synthase component I, partial [Planctomycetota bacterium]